MSCSNSRVPDPCTGTDYVLTLHTHAAAKRSLSGRSLKRCSSADIRQPCPDTMQGTASRAVFAVADWVKASDGWVNLDSGQTGNRSSLTSQIANSAPDSGSTCCNPPSALQASLDKGSSCLQSCGSLCTWRHLVLASRKSIPWSCFAA